MTEFKMRHHNRLQFPDRHVVICEDDILHQREFMQKMESLFERQGKVKVSIVPDSLTAALIIDKASTVAFGVNLLILDHDLIFGNGSELISYLKAAKSKIPILTASGWEPNNAIYREALKDYEGKYVITLKQHVINGVHDDFILANAHTHIENQGA